MTDFFELSVKTTSKGIDPLTGCLLEIAVGGFWIEESSDLDDLISEWELVDADLVDQLKAAPTCVKFYLPKTGSGFENLRKVKIALKALKSRDVENLFGELELNVSDVSEEDWANNWKQYFKPFKIGRRIIVKPSWETVSNIEERIVVEIDPMSSFGTGQHETTRLCLEALDKTVCGGETVLDVGCGSGILSVAAVLLGAVSAAAIDIDETAVKATAENASKNGIENNINAITGNLLTDVNLQQSITEQKFDIVCANIVADIIISMLPVLKAAMKPGGILILSGIICERLEEVLCVMKKNGLKDIKTEQDSGWCLVLAKGE